MSAATLGHWAASADQGTLDHVLRPAAGQPEGALILIHGRGADEHDLRGMLDQLDPERRLLGVTPGGPLLDVPPFGGRHWYVVPRVGYPDHDTFHRSYQLLTGFLDGLLAEHGIAWDKVVLGGFSMGSVMSYATALGPGRPKPAALLINSGFIPVVDGWTPELDDMAGLDVLIHHGRHDPIMQVDFGRQAAQLLTNAGANVDYVETDAAHFIPPQLIGREQALVERVTA